MVARRPIRHFSPVKLLLPSVTMLTRWSRSTSNFYALIGQNLKRWVHAENFCSILNLLYFDSWSWQSFVSTCDVFNCLLPLDWNSTVISSLLLFMASLFIGFLVEKYVACQSRKSDFGWHHFRFHLAWCVRGLQSLKRYWPYLITFRSCIANGKPEKLLYLMFFLCVYNSMKLSVVYAGI